MLFIHYVESKLASNLGKPPDAKSWLIGKDPNAGKDWRQEEKGTTENEIAGWHHWLNGHEFEQASGVGDRQGSLACCLTWSYKESDTTKQLNWTDQDRKLNQAKDSQWSGSYSKHLDISKHLRIQNQVHAFLPKFGSPLVFIIWVNSGDFIAPKGEAAWDPPFPPSIPNSRHAPTISQIWPSLSIAP